MAVPKLIYEIKELLVSPFKSFTYYCCAVPFFLLLNEESSACFLLVTPLAHAVIMSFDLIAALLSGLVITSLDLFGTRRGIIALDA